MFTGLFTLLDCILDCYFLSGSHLWMWILVDFAYPHQVNGCLLFIRVSPLDGELKSVSGPHTSAPNEWLGIESALLPRRKLSNAGWKRSMVPCMAPLQSLVNREYCGVSFEKTLDLPSTYSPFVETKERKEQDALYSGDNLQKNTLLQATENDDFSNQNSRQSIVQDPSTLPLYTFTGTQH